MISAATSHRIRNPALVGTWAGRSTAWLVGAVALLLLAAGPATAHNTLVSSKPAEQETMAATPGSVVLTFTEPVLGMGARVVVTGPGGEVQQGPPRMVDTTVTQDLRGDAAAGSYTVDWRVTSADGHPISGRYTFSSRAPGAGQPDPPPAEASPPAAGPGSGVQGWLWITGGLGALALVTALLTRGRRRRPAGAQARSVFR